MDYDSNMVENMLNKTGRIGIWIDNIACYPMHKLVAYKSLWEGSYERCKIDNDE